MIYNSFCFWIRIILLIKFWFSLGSSSPIHSVTGFAIQIFKFKFWSWLRIVNTLNWRFGMEYHFVSMPLLNGDDELSCDRQCNYTVDLRRRAQIKIFLMRKRILIQLQKLFYTVWDAFHTLSGMINNSTWNSNLNLSSNWNSKLSLVFNLDFQF